MCSPSKVPSLHLQTITVYEIILKAACEAWLAFTGRQSYMTRLFDFIQCFEITLYYRRRPFFTRDKFFAIFEIESTTMKFNARELRHYISTPPPPFSNTHTHTPSTSWQLCIILNNMSHVRTALTNMRQKLELHKFYRWLTEKEDIGKQAENLIDKLLSSADEDIGNKISQIVASISRKVWPCRI